MTERADDFSLDEIVARFGGQLVGDGRLRVRQVATLASAGPGDFSFLANRKYRSQLTSCRASALVLSSADADACTIARILSEDPYAYFARVAQLLNPPHRNLPGIHPSARCESEIPASVHIGAGVVIGRGVLIGDGCSIGAGSVIGDETMIGAQSRIYPNVTIYEGCSIGQRAIIHSGAVIGADGFGFAREPDGSWLKIPQIGRVMVGDDAEIGANTTIDRGTLGDTVIGEGVKLDNQIQIAHNVRIGAHTAMAGCVGVAGSTTIGSHCTFGGSAGILGHLTIADDVHVSAMTLVTKSISRPGTYTGSMPFEAHPNWLKNAAHLRHLESMAEKIRLLEARLAHLEKNQ